MEHIGITGTIILACMLVFLAAGSVRGASIDLNPDAFETIVGQPFAVDVFVYNFETGKP